MSAAGKPIRTRRGRTMIVGRIPELTVLLSRARHSMVGPMTARNLFDAIGHITSAPVGAPIATVVIAAEAVPRGTQAIEAIRKVDPAVRIVIIASRGMTDDIDPQTWHAQGVDEVIETPMVPADLHRLFDEDFFSPGNTVIELSDTPEPVVHTVSTSESRRSVAGTDQGGITAKKTDPVAVQPVQKPAASATATTNPSPTVVPHSAGIRNAPPVKTATTARVVDSATVPPPSSSPPPTNTHPTLSQAIASSETLGDIDLVSAIMSASDQVASLAVRLIVQQTHWHDLELVQENTSAKSTAFAAVVAGTLRLGYLATTRAAADQLQPWADWLAHWLALNESHRSLQQQALLDDLTGAGNRRFFDSFLLKTIQQASKSRRPVTVMVFDIDNFKSYNDQFGHEAGDEILHETVRLMQAVIRKGDRVCRIGGDEFAVIFADDEAPRSPGSRHPESIESIAKRFQDQICKMKFPKLGAEAPGTLTISAGLATYPWDGHDPESLLRKADQLALESKRKGKNAITFGPGAAETCRPPHQAS